MQNFSRLYNRHVKTCVAFHEIMKLTCNVEVHCRLLSSTNVPARRKAQRGCLTIARPTVKNNELVLFLQTATNKLGTKYKIDQNVERVFAKFVDDGKATIRLREPPHDLIIKSDVIQLKSFLHVLKLGLSKKIDPSVLSVSNINPKTLTVQKTKVVITKKSEYPVLEGFPRTTEILHLAKLGRKSFDRQILRLQSLRVLDLSENLLTSLPNELGTLPNLTELYLTSNQLTFSSPSKWSWMNATSIRTTLKLLDISSNMLSELPDRLGKLSSLVTLKIGDNSLNKIPQSIGTMTSLKYLDLQKNVLNCLPGSMKNLRLRELDVSANPFSSAALFIQSGAASDYGIDPMAGLMEIAARVVIQSRIHYDASKVPPTVVQYLDGARYCVCGKACFQTSVRQLIEMNLHQIADSVTSSGNSTVPFDCYFCSVKCTKRYAPLF